MTLSSMLVSRDWSEVSVLECILSGLHIGVDVEPEPDRARVKLAKSKVDALIVDCDLEGTSGLLREMGDAINFVPLVIASKSKDRQRLQNSGAAFFFEKPISVEQAVHTLSAARNLILDGRLRYHRQSMNIPISLAIGQAKKIDAHVINLSQGGIGIRLEKPEALCGGLKVDFTLPGKKLHLNLKGQVAWTDERGHAGIRFVFMSGRTKKNLQLWLAQRYLTQ